MPKVSAYGNTTTITPGHTIYTPLNNFAKGINDEYQYTTNKKFNIGIYDEEKSYESLSGEIIEANVGLPVVGEMFSGNDIDIGSPKIFVDTNLIENMTIRECYWTMNRSNQFLINNVNDSGYLNNYEYDFKYGVRPVIFLNKNLELKSGDGSPSAPYELKNDEPK